MSYTYNLSEVTPEEFGEECAELRDALETGEGTTEGE